MSKDKASVSRVSGNIGKDGAKVPHKHGEISEVDLENVSGGGGVTGTTWTHDDESPKE